MTPVPVPDRFQGAWRRVSIAVDRGPPTEPASVVWVQASSAYADLRLPDDPGATTMSFAGTTRWDDPFLRWEHALDLEATSGEDVGEVSWDGTDLVESGSFVSDGRPVGYVEVWRLQPGSGGPRRRWCWTTAPASSCAPVPTPSPSSTIDRRAAAIAPATARSARRAGPSPWRCAASRRICRRHPPRPPRRPEELSS